MQIYIKNEKGDKIEIGTSPEEAVLELKKKVASKLNIPLQETNIYLENSPLGDEKKIQDFKIMPFAVLGLHPEVVRIHEEDKSPEMKIPFGI